MKNMRVEVKMRFILAAAVFHVFGILSKGIIRWINSIETARI